MCNRITEKPRTGYDLCHWGAENDVWVLVDKLEHESAVNC